MARSGGPAGAGRGVAEHHLAPGVEHGEPVDHRLRDRVEHLGPCVRADLGRAQPLGAVAARSATPRESISVMTAVTMTNSCTTMARTERSAMVPKGPQPCRVQTHRQAAEGQRVQAADQRGEPEADPRRRRDQQEADGQLVVGGEDEHAGPQRGGQRGEQLGEARGGAHRRRTSTSEPPSPRRSALRMTSTEAATTKAPQALRITQVENVRVDQCSVLIQTAADPDGGAEQRSGERPGASSSRSLALLIPGRRSAGSAGVAEPRGDHAYDESLHQVGHPEHRRGQRRAAEAEDEQRGGQEQQQASK